MELMKLIPEADIRIAHGQMSKEELEDTMNSFINNEFNILLCTTIIETGIDIPNVNTLIIYDADRFGLSQLHQLRGRVGRNDLQSYCVLISDREANRLDIMTKTTDGFKISEEDFKLRGSGDLFGVRQSGDMNFRLANFKTDFNILMKAKEDTEYMLDNNINDYKVLIDLLNNSVNLD
jgi:ATP-dependent DNA helicase RecG